MLGDEVESPLLRIFLKHSTLILVILMVPLIILSLISHDRDALMFVFWIAGGLILYESFLFYRKWAHIQELKERENLRRQKEREIKEKQREIVQRREEQERAQARQIHERYETQQQIVGQERKIKASSELLARQTAKWSLD